jgi:hypothetical protein
MVRGKRILLLGMTVAMMHFLAACASTHSTSASRTNKQYLEHVEEMPRVPDEYLVTLAENADATIIYEYFKRFGIKYVHELGEETYLLIVAHDPGPREMDKLIRDETRIRLVQPNLVQWDYR